MAINKKYRNLLMTGTLALLGVILFITPAKVGSQAAQQDQKEDERQLSYHVDVSVTQVEVVVTDKQGKRVTDLKPENFQLYEDGVLQKTSNFYEVKAMDVYTADTPANSPIDTNTSEVTETSAAVVQPQPESSDGVVSSPLLNRIVIYFDNWQLHPLNRNWSISKLRTFIEKNFPPGGINQGMVVTHGRKLRILQKFTPHKELLLRALERVKERSGQTAVQSRRKAELRNELNRIVEDTSRFDRNSGFETAMTVARNFVEEEQSYLQLSIKSLNAFINHLSGLQGRKVLIYVSDGLSINPSEEVFGFLNQAYPTGNAQNEAMNYDAARLFKDLTTRCNANEITLYPINARGLETGILGADSERGWSTAKGSGMVKSGSRAHSDALRMMAQDTGGVAILETNNFDAGLTRIKDDLHFYYSLGYRSLYQGDNKYHAIKVKLAGLPKTNYNVRVRSGFMQFSPEEKIKENVMSRLFLKRMYNPMGIKMKVLPTQGIAFSSNVKLNIKLWLPIKNITLKPRRDDYFGRFKVYVMLKDDAGQVSLCRELAKDVIIPNNDYETAMNSSFPYIVEMYVAPGRYDISIAVQDTLGGSTSYVQIEQKI